MYYDKHHDDVIKWKYFPRYWPFVWGIHRWPVNSPHKGQWRGVLMLSWIWINDWVNNLEAGDLRRHRAHYDVIVMTPWFCNLPCGSIKPRPVPILLSDWCFCDLRAKRPSSAEWLTGRWIEHNRYRLYGTGSVDQYIYTTDVINLQNVVSSHDDVETWLRFPHFWLFVRESNGHRIPRTKG